MEETNERIEELAVELLGLIDEEMAAGMSHKEVHKALGIVTGELQRQQQEGTENGKQEEGDHQAEEGTEIS